jgi:PASTA domain
VCGVFLFPHAKAEWRDIRGNELKLPDYIPPPKPKPKTTVPNLVGLLSSQAHSVLKAAQLRAGQVWNPTGEIRSNYLRVKGQDPAAGTSVSEGTGVNYSVELAQEQKGVKSIVLANRHQQGRSVEVFLWDSAIGTWSSKGMLNFAASTTLSLSSGRVYKVVALDRGLINCTDGQPDTVSCQRFHWGASGDSAGVQVTLNVT